MRHPLPMNFPLDKFAHDLRQSLRAIMFSTQRIERQNDAGGETARTGDAGGPHQIVTVQFRVAVDPFSQLLRGRVGIAVVFDVA